MAITAASETAFVMMMTGREAFQISGRSNADGGYTQYAEFGFSGTSTPFMTMKEGGKVGVNTPEPTAPLHVTGNIKTTGGSAEIDGELTVRGRGSHRAGLATAPLSSPH